MTDTYTLTLNAQEYVTLALAFGIGASAVKDDETGVREGIALVNGFGRERFQYAAQLVHQHLGEQIAEAVTTMKEELSHEGVDGNG